MAQAMVMMSPEGQRIMGALIHRKIVLCDSDTLGDFIRKYKLPYDNIATKEEAAYSLVEYLLKNEMYIYPRRETPRNSRPLQQAKGTL